MGLGCTCMKLARTQTGAGYTAAGRSEPVAQVLERVTVRLQPGPCALLTPPYNWGFTVLRTRHLSTDTNPDSISGRPKVRKAEAYLVFHLLQSARQCKRQGFDPGQGRPHRRAECQRSPHAVTTEPVCLDPVPQREKPLQREACMS